MSPELDALLRLLNVDPAQLGDLTPVAEQALTASLRAGIGAGLPAEEQEAAAASPAAAWSPGDLLTIDEAAASLRISPRWLYRHHKQLPFARQLSRKALRFSRFLMTRWLANKRT